MSYDKDKHNAYQKASQNVSELQQVIMLYEGAINFIEQGKQAIKNKDFEGRYNQINKAVAIITGLNSCLEFNEQTDETAKALDDFYQTIDMRLLYITTNDSIEDSIKECDNVIADLRTMLNAWKDIANGEADEANTQFTMPTPLQEADTTTDLNSLQNIQITI